MKLVLSLLLAVTCGFVSRSKAQTDTTHPWQVVDIGTGSLIGMTGFGTRDSLYILSGGKLLKTFDGGRMWTSTALPRYSWSGMFMDAMNGILMLGNDSVLKTTDGGNTWTKHYSVVSRPKCWTHVGRDVLFIGGSFEASKSTDGGETWHGMDFPGDANGIAFFNENIGYAMGPEVLWTGPPPPQSGTRWASFLLTHDGGNYWKTVWSKIEHEGVSALFETTNGTLIAGCGSANIYTSYDEGHNWDTIRALREGTGYAAINFVDTLHGCAAGADGLVTWTDDGGITWRDVSFPTLLDFYGVKVVDSATAYVSGENGLLIKTTTAGTSWVPLHRKSALTASLYPNPAENIVTISYTLPRAQHVTLTVVSSIGETVMTLLDGSAQDEGERTIEFDASALPKGSYPYHIESEDFDHSGGFSVVH